MIGYSILNSYFNAHCHSLLSHISPVSRQRSVCVKDAKKTVTWLSQGYSGTQRTQLTGSRKDVRHSGNYVTLCFCQIMECPSAAPPEGGVFVLMIKRPRENGNIIAYLFLQHFSTLNWNDRVAV